MGITSSLVTALSGLSANQDTLSVVGNNIANSNTVGFKTSRLDFKTQLSQTLSEGTQPGDTGGTNPLQIGYGTQQGSISKNFTNGSRTTTGVNTDLAIQGDGFFIVQGKTTAYTRDGTFKLNSSNQLVDGSGDFVQGFGVDSKYNVVPGVLQNITIPEGTLTVAGATTSATFDGNLNSGGVVATTPSVNTLNQPLYLAGSGAVDPTNPPTGSTLATNLVDATNTAYFQTGDILTAKPTKGLRSQTAQTLTITGTTTLANIETFLTNAAGINTASGANGSAATPGVTTSVSGNTATLSITGNLGAQNDLAFPTGSLTITRGGVNSSPFSFTDTTKANGESVYTSMTAYDSLGSPVQVNITATLTSAGATGTQWQWTAESPDSKGGGSQIVGTGTLDFDNYGTLKTPAAATISVSRTGTGAVDPMIFTPNFQNLTALSGTNSQLAESTQDGYAKGTLTSFSIGTDGVITGAFTNGQTKSLGQVALATFRNNLGLVDNGNNTYTPGPNSGDPAVSAPNQFNAGSVISGSLEQSNVDLSQEFVNMISASTGFSANSRVITTSNQLLQELLAAAR